MSTLHLLAAGLWGMKAEIPLCLRGGKESKDDLRSLKKHKNWEAEMKLRVLLYKSKLGDGHWIDNAISLWTSIFNWWTGPYSHGETWTLDEVGQFSRIYNVAGGIITEYYGVTYTSTMRGEINGNVCRPASEVLTHPERWDYVEIEVEDALFEQAKKWADKRVANNKGYSKKDLARFFMPLWILKLLGLYDNKKQICSEEVAMWLVDLLIFSKPEPLMSPRRLSAKLVKLGYKIKLLKGA